MRWNTPAHHGRQRRASLLQFSRPKSTHSARLWDAKTGEELRVFAGHGAQVYSIAFDVTGTLVLTGSDIIRLWSIADIAARLESERKPNGLELRWHVGALQQSTDVNGPWFNVTNATSPW